MAWVLPILTGVMSVMEAVTFIQFIQEEAIQSCQLGAFLAMRQKNYKAVGWACQTTRGTLLAHLKSVNFAVGWMAPYSDGAFQDFITATEVSLDLYDELLLSAIR